MGMPHSNFWYNYAVTAAASPYLVILCFVYNSLTSSLFFIFEFLLFVCLFIILIDWLLWFLFWWISSLMGLCFLSWSNLSFCWVLFIFRSIHGVRDFVVSFWSTPFLFCLLWSTFYSFGLLKPIKHAPSYIKNCNASGISSPQALILLVDSFSFGRILVGFLFRLIQSSYYRDLLGFLFQSIHSLYRDLLWFLFRSIGIWIGISSCRVPLSVSIGWVLVAYSGFSSISV